MAKYLVETYYTCTFKVNHYLDDINEAELKNLEKRDDGKFEVLDVKLDNRKTKSLDPVQNNLNIRWERDAENILNKYLEKEPILVQISRAKKLREQLETDCKERGLSEVTEFMVIEYLNLNSERSEIQNAEEKV